MPKIDGNKRCAACRHIVNIRGRMKSRTVEANVSLGGKIVKVTLDICKGCYDDIFKGVRRAMSCGG